jgi:hypothetical protein
MKTAVWLAALDDWLQEAAVSVSQPEPLCHDLFGSQSSFITIKAISREPV